MIVDIGINQAKINLVHEQRHKYWLIKYLEGKVGETYHALVLSHSLNRCELLLTDYLLETSIPSSTTGYLTPGTTIEVKLETADALKGLIRVVPIKQSTS